MKGKKTIKFIAIIAIVLVALIIVGIILYTKYSKNEGISISDSEIKNLVGTKNSEVKDEQLKKFYNDLISEGEKIIVSKESANSLEDAQKLATEYKDKINKELPIDLKGAQYLSYTNFDYTNYDETKYYYRFMGEYTYKYQRAQEMIEDYSVKYEFLIFKSNYFDFPNLKNYHNKQEIKEFGDLLAILKYGNNRIIKSTVKSDRDNYTYNVFYVIRYIQSPDGPTEEILGVNYSLIKASFTVNKSTGETNLTLDEDNDNYERSNYPIMNLETIRSFYEGR